jgi:cellulose biosynthesis protein BcsQ
MKVISFFNNKGGTGKTTLAISVAKNLSNGCKTLIIDMDAQANSTLILTQKREKTIK